jgi:hypothetical protein
MEEVLVNAGDTTHAKNHCQKFMLHKIPVVYLIMKMS